MRAWQAILAGGVIFALASCSTIDRRHGYAPTDEELAEIVVGVDDRASVEETVGKPGTAGVLGENAWYYMSQMTSTWAYRAPQVTDRQLVAISFNDNGIVQNIERFGLEDGQVVTLSRRITKTSIRNPGFIRQLLRNFGRIDAGSILAGE